MSSPNGMLSNNEMNVGAVAAPASCVPLPLPLSSLTSSLVASAKDEQCEQSQHDHRRHMNGIHHAHARYTNTNTLHHANDTSGSGKQRNNDGNGLDHHTLLTLVRELRDRMYRVWRTPFLRYAIASSIFALLCYRARHPRSKLQTMFSVVTSLVPSELSIQLLVGQGMIFYWLMTRMSTPSFKELSTISRVPGYIAATTTIASLYSLARMAGEIITSRSLINDTLSKHGIPSSSSRSPWWHWLMNLTPLPWFLSRGIQNKTDITYHSIRTKDLKLDIYWHKTKRLPNAPVFMYIHGGGWIMGDKYFGSIPLLYQIAATGWVVVSVNYRLSPAVRFPTHLIDCKRALAWIKQHIHQYNADGSFIVVGGESAGGHLASLIASTANDVRYQAGFEHVDTTVQGLIDLYGAHDWLDENHSWTKRDAGGFQKFLQYIVMQRNKKKFTEEWELASPLHRVRRNTAAGPTKAASLPPMLVIHGAHDTLIPVEDSRHFVAEVAKNRKIWNEDKAHMLTSSTSTIAKESSSESLVLSSQPINDIEVSKSMTPKALTTSSSKVNEQQMSEPLTSGRVKDVYLELPGAHHGFNQIISLRTLATGDAVTDYLTALRQHQHSKPPTTDTIRSKL